MNMNFPHDEYLNSIQDINNLSKVLAHVDSINSDFFYDVHINIEDNLAEVTLNENNKEKTLFTYHIITVYDVCQKIKNGEPVNLDGFYIKNFNYEDIEKICGDNIVLDIFSARKTFFDGDTSFCNARFAPGDIFFTNAIFANGSVFFNNAQFGDGIVDFNRTQFISSNPDDEVIFTDANFGYGNIFFRYAAFTHANVSFDNVNFGAGSVYFEGVHFGDGYTYFGWSQFSGALSFYCSKFGKTGLSFYATKFGNANLCFRYTNFGKGNISFNHAQFGIGAVIFYDAKFGSGTVSFASAVFNNDQLLFDGVEAGTTHVLFSDSFLSHNYNFGSCSFEKLEFYKCTIENILRLDNCKVNEISFHETKNLGKIFIDWYMSKKAIYQHSKKSHKNNNSFCVINEIHAEEFKMLKENFKSIGEYEFEDLSFVEYMRCYRKTKLLFKFWFMGVRQIGRIWNEAFAYIFLDVRSDSIFWDYFLYLPSKLSLVF